jgi:hypothetical protein
MGKEEKERSPQKRYDRCDVVTERKKCDMCFSHLCAQDLGHDTGTHGAATLAQGETLPHLHDDIAVKHDLEGDVVTWHNLSKIKRVSNCG